MAPPISIKLRCNSWKQLAALYKRDLARSAVFLKSSAPPPLDTPVRIHLTLPNRELVILDGVVSQHIPPGGLNGRGPGVDIKVPEIPGPAMAKIQAALENPDEGAGGAEGKGRARPETSAGVEIGGGDEDSGASTSEPAEPPGQPDLLGLGEDTPTPTPRATPRREPPARATRPAPPPPSTPGFLDDDFLGDLGQPATPPAPAVETPAPSQDAAELVARLEQERESLRKLNAFQILGVGYETTDEAVHEAFASLSQRYHPERFAGDENESAREIATEIFALIRAAHRLLESSTARERLRKELNRAPRSDDAAGATPPGREKVAAPASPQEEIPTKPVLVAEDGTRVGGDGAGVPAAPQEEIPTKPAVVSADGTVEPAGTRPAAPPPTPPTSKARPPAPPPIPGRGAPPPVPKTRPPAPPPIPSNKRAAEELDEDIIPVDDVIPLDDDIAIDLGEDAAPAAAPVSAPVATETSAPTPLAAGGEDLGADVDDLGDVAAGQPAEDTAAASDASDFGSAFDAVTAPPVEEAPPPVSLLVDETDFSDAGAEPPPPIEPEAVAPPVEPEAVAPPVEDVQITADEPPPEEAAPADHSELGLAAAPRFEEAIALLVAGRFNEAATAYRMVRRRDPDDVGARVGAELCEALKALANRDKLEAAQRFEAVLELDPENRRAAEELAEMRRQAAQQRKANLSRLRDQQD